MKKLDRADLWTLEAYAEQRAAFRAKVIEHKKSRRVALHPNATLYFEDALTIKYQVQEMLRVERIFEAAAIEEELAAYNPLIPDGSNWKCTLMLEFPDVEERRRRLAAMPGVEHRVWAQVAGRPRILAVANEDMERSNEDKTAAVHFLRFELEPEDVAAIRAGADVRLGIDHEELRCEVVLGDAGRRSLAADLD